MADERGAFHRAVEKDFLWYDAPDRIWGIINRGVWPYRRDFEFFKLRDLAFMCLLYWATARASELCRFRAVQGDRMIGVLPSVKASQFVKVDKEFMALRNLRILKRSVERVEEYPMRNEILLPLEGDLAVFTGPVLSYLDRLGSGEELFKFHKGRAHQIVMNATRLPGSPNPHEDVGLMPHFLRDQGLKFRLRLYEKNLKTLQSFSGHARVENLLRYLGEIEDRAAILGYRFG